MIKQNIILLAIASVFIFTYSCLPPQQPCIKEEGFDLDCADGICFLFKTTYDELSNPIGSPTRITFDFDKISLPSVPEIWISNFFHTAEGHLTIEWTLNAAPILGTRIRNKWDRVCLEREEEFNNKITEV